MYTRSFYPEGREDLTIPKNYDGTALSHPNTETASTYRENDEKAAHENFFKEDFDEPCANIFSSEKNDSGGFLSGLFSKLQIKNLGGIFKGGEKELKIGTEELIIIGISLFLLFSKSGDKECGVLLLLLLFF